MQNLIKEKSKLAYKSRNYLTPVRTFSLDSAAKVDPWFITGFADAESSFIVSLTQKNRLKTGWLVYAAFQISLHEKDRALLELIQAFFGVGKINKHGKHSIQYRVSSTEDLKVIIDHFYKYPLISQKLADYLLFKKILAIIVVLGLNITKQARMKLGSTAQPQFRTCQHERDLGVLKRIILTMGCGVIVQPSEGRDRYSTSVSNITELSTIVIPFFQKYPLYGAKGLDFQDFAEGISIMEKKGHLTQEGLDRLKDLAYNMNTFREF